MSCARPAIVIARRWWTNELFSRAGCAPRPTLQPSCRLPLARSLSHMKHTPVSTLPSTAGTVMSTPAMHLRGNGRAVIAMTRTAHHGSFTMRGAGCNANTRSQVGWTPPAAAAPA